MLIEPLSERIGALLDSLLGLSQRLLRVLGGGGGSASGWGLSFRRLRGLLKLLLGLKRLLPSGGADGLCLLLEGFGRRQFFQSLLMRCGAIQIARRIGHGSLHGLLLVGRGSQLTLRCLPLSGPSVVLKQFLQRTGDLTGPRRSLLRQARRKFGTGVRTFQWWYWLPHLLALLTRLLQSIFLLLLDRFGLLCHGLRQL